MEVAAVSLPGPLTLPLSPSLSYMSLISLHLCQATVRTSGCGINFARRVRPDRNERPSGEMAARRGEAEREGGRLPNRLHGGREERGRVVAPWEVFIYAGHVAPQPNSRKKTSLGSWDGS